MFNSPFTVGSEEVSIPDEVEIIFVSDLFSSDHVGGAELTTDALIDASPYKVFRLHSKDVSEKTLSQGHDRFWIFGNFSGMNLDFLPGIISNLNYSVVEYDYKYCRYRSTEKHESAESKPCDCHENIHGKMVSAFYYAAKSMWWMSEMQMQKYHNMFPFLSTIKNVVLSSVFDESFFHTISSLVKSSESAEREKWLVVGSNSWIKGTQQSVDYCENNDLDYEVVSGVGYEEMLKKMAKSKGLVFLPMGDDTCPRIVIEAKLLGCDLVLNEHVQHVKEEWFSTSDGVKTLDHLYNARERFWTGIRSHIEYIPSISGYTTTHNCLDQNYPFEASILSMIDFCDQVVVVDGGSTDGTWERLQKLTEIHERLLIHQQPRDWNSVRFAVFDGLQKALGRALCTGEFCWQQDSDEVLHEDDYSKVREIVRKIPKNMDLVALPVVEFWGGPEKVRIDVTPWKWRLSRNRPHITHGIPSSLRNFDDEGRLYASPGTDGCDYVRSDSFDPIPFGNFYTEDAHKLRLNALNGDSNSLDHYERWITAVTGQLPSIYHYSWFDIKRKINTYKNYWSKHWQSLYNIEQEDTSENNMFFDKPWSEVSKREITNLSKKLSKNMGGWIFHTKIDFSAKTPHISLNREHPSHIKKWISK